MPTTILVLCLLAQPATPPESVPAAAPAPEPAPAPAPAPVPVPAPVPAPTSPTTEAPLSSPSASPAEQPADPRQPVLILDTRAAGVDATWAAQLTHELARVADGFSSYRVITVADLHELATFVQDQQSLGCETDDACLAKIAELSSARWVLTSSLGQVGNNLVLNLSLVDAHAGQTASRVSETAATLRDLVDRIPRILGGFFGEESVQRRYRWSGDPFSCAVLDLKPNGVDPSAADNLTQVLSSAVRSIEGATVISRDDVMAMLEVEAKSQMLGCDDTACMAEIGGALGVDKLVVGSVGKLGDTYIISLRLIDIAASEVENRVSESFVSAADQLLGAVGKAARDLFGIVTDEPGQLMVSVSEAEAEIYLNGVRLGQTPVPPFLGIAPGRHSLRVSKEGYFEWEGDVYVNPEQLTGQWVQLEATPDPWYKKWWVWTIAGSAIVASVTIAVVMTVAQDTGSLRVLAIRPGVWE